MELFCKTVLLASVVLMPLCSAADISISDNLYLGLERAITKSVVDPNKNSTSNVEILSRGIPLSYSQFNPGVKIKNKVAHAARKKDVLPSDIFERTVQLIDNIYPSRFSRENVATDFKFTSVSKAYGYILSRMILITGKEEIDIEHARDYLNELVDNVEKVIRDDKLARYTLYDYYRSNYYEVKQRQEDYFHGNKSNLPQRQFEIWGFRKLPQLVSDTNSAFYKWQIHGFKSKVEDMLQGIGISRDNEDLLKDAIAVYLASTVLSTHDVHKNFHHFDLEPQDWYRLLNPKLPESSDELEYRKSMMLAQYNFYAKMKDKLSKMNMAPVEAEKSSAQKQVENDVQDAADETTDILEMEFNCYTSDDSSACKKLKSKYVNFRYRSNELISSFNYLQYLESILQGRGISITEIDELLDYLISNITAIDAQILYAEHTEKEINIANGNKTSCTEPGNIFFTFDSKDAPASDPGVLDPVIKKSMWDVYSCVVNHDLQSLQLLHDFQDAMANADVKITASLRRVDIDRHWFDVAIFTDPIHYSIKNGSGVVSPGQLNSVNAFQNDVYSGGYLLPQYPSSFILASDIKIFYPRFELAQRSYLNYLMKYASTMDITGSIGPFSLDVPAGEDYIHNYQLKRENGGLMIVIPGGQIVGYIMQSFPMFPTSMPMEL